MICVLDAVNREELYDYVTDIDIFEDNFERLKQFFQNMFYRTTPQQAVFFMSLFGSFLGDDIASYLLNRFDHLNYNDEEIIIEEKTFDEYVNLSTTIASDLRIISALEPSIYPILLVKGEDNRLYLNLFIL